MDQPNNLCKKHDGFIQRFIAGEARITKTEDNVRALWKRLDKIVLIGFLILGGMVANLIVMLLKE